MISYLGLLVQSCYREGGALQTDIAVCGEHSQSSGHTGFPPAHGCVLSPSTLLRLPAGLQGAGWPCVACGSSFRVLCKSADLVAPVFCAFPGLSGSGSQRLGHTLPRCARLFPLRRAAQATRGSGALSPDAAHHFPPRPQRTPLVGCLRLAFVQRSWPLDATLLAADSQEFFR